MSKPIPGVKYRIQTVDLQTCIELLDTTANPDHYCADNAGLRPMRATDRQYWTFERVPDNSDFFYVRNVANTYHMLGWNSPTNAYTGTNSIARYGKVRVTQLGDGACRPSFFFDGKDYYWYSDTGSITKLTPLQQGITNLGSRWQLVPVEKLYLLPITGVYRIRNLNGRSHLMCGKDDNEVYVESQVDQSNYYQRWNVTVGSASSDVTLQTYVIQNVGSELYLGCSSNAIPESGDNLVGVETAFQWDVQIMGGFAVSFCIPNKKLSLGLADYSEVDSDWDEYTPRLQLVPSDIAPNQMWYMEDLKFTHNKMHPLPEGKYLLQSCHDQTIYMTGARSPYRITTGTATTSQFKLKYINDKSALFTLTYVTDANVVPAVAYDGEYITLKRNGTQFLLVKQAKDRYIIEHPVSGYLRKVVSARAITDMDDNPVFSIEDETGEALQKWRFIPVQKNRIYRSST